jgi:hypothetical protein
MLNATINSVDRRLTGWKRRPSSVRIHVLASPNCRCRSTCASQPSVGFVIEFCEL